MRERQVIDAVNKRVPKTIHRQSMTSASLTANGTPDYYYDGPGGDLWVEYKSRSAMPRNGIVVPELTPLQLAWLERRYNHSLPHVANAVVVVGLPNRTAVMMRLPTEWREGKHVRYARPLEEIAAWITGFCSL
jgi:hypothetical protein